MSGKQSWCEHSNLGLIVCLAVAIAMVDGGTRVAATTPARPLLLAQRPLEQQQAEAETDKQQLIQAKIKNLLQLPLPATAVTSKTSTPLASDVPSLWWTHEQFGSKLVTDWQIVPSDQADLQHVRLQVRSGIWARYSYAERYAVVNNFGTELRMMGYQLIVLDRQNAAIAAYLCHLASPMPIAEPSTPTEQTAQPPCHLWLSPRYPHNKL